MLPAFLTGCGIADGRITTSTHGPSAGVPTGTPADRVGLPLPRQVAKKLPGGAFYVLAGPNPSSLNLWVISNSGNETRLTSNRLGYGISSYGASVAGIVMADASNGLDRIARLTARGTVFLKNGRGSDPSINSAGQICYVTPAYDNTHPFFELMEMNAFGGARRALYKQRAVISAIHWGPGKAIGLISGSHYPGTRGPVPKLLILRRDSKIKTVKTGLSALSNLTWSERAFGLAVNNWTGDSKIISPGGHSLLPKGWMPAAWNPSGSELLVRGPRSSLGIWRPDHPTSVRVIGTLISSVTVVEFQWLSKPVLF
jgi:hypothetical protein